MHAYINAYMHAGHFVENEFFNGHRCMHAGGTHRDTYIRTYGPAIPLRGGGIEAAMTVTFPSCQREARGARLHISQHMARKGFRKKSCDEITNSRQARRGEAAAGRALQSLKGPAALERKAPRSGRR